MSTPLLAVTAVGLHLSSPVLLCHQRYDHHWPAPCARLMSRVRFGQNHGWLALDKDFLLLFLFALGSSVSAIDARPPFSHRKKLRFLLSPPSEHPTVRPHDFGHICARPSGSANLLRLQFWQTS